LFEELQACDVERTREVYKACLQLIPHQVFSFGKIWVMAAQFELRQKDLPAARKILGQALGRCGKESLFKRYIHLELQMGEIDRCRILYSKYLEKFPHSCEAWSKFSELERTVGETERARGVYELAIEQPLLDMPETLWKAYIDMEVEEGETKNVRKLYERLLERTGHVKVWISFAQFEAASGGGAEVSRKVFERADAQLKSDQAREERVLLLEAWREMEKTKGDEASLKAVDAKMPKRIKKKRLVTGDGGEELGWEEYYDYAFPDDRTQPQSLKILQMAQKWKESQSEESNKGTKRKASDDP